MRSRSGSWRHRRLRFGRRVWHTRRPRATAFTFGRRTERQHAQQGHRKTGDFIGRIGQIVLAVNRNLIMQLRLFRRQRAREAQHIIALRSVVGNCLRSSLRYGNFGEQGRQLIERAGERQTAREHFISHRHHRGGVAGNQCIEHAHKIGGVDGAKHAAHGFFGHLARAIGDGLIGERERIAHAARSPLRDQAQARLLKIDFLFGEHVFEVRDDLRLRHLLEVELQAARQHRHRNLLRVGGGEDELHMLGRLFERLQHRVERSVGEHVHLVDHQHLVARRVHLVRG